MTGEASYPRLTDDDVEALRAAARAWDRELSEQALLELALIIDEHRPDEGPGLGARETKQQLRAVRELARALLEQLQRLNADADAALVAALFDDPHAARKDLSSLIRAAERAGGAHADLARCLRAYAEAADLALKDATAKRGANFKTSRRHLAYLTASWFRRRVGRPSKTRAKGSPRARAFQAVLRVALGAAGEPAPDLERVAFAAVDDLRTLGEPAGDDPSARPPE